jgi:hypothetical protein
VSPGPGDLYAAAQELMAATADAVATSPGGPIDFDHGGVQAIWPGLPSYDCVPALYVHAGGAAIGDTYPLQPPLQPMQRMVTTGQVPLLQLTITVLRCVPVIEEDQQSIVLPSQALIEAAAQQVYGDLWAIWNHLKNEHRAGNLFQRPSGRREFIFDPAVPVRTSGGAGGWEIPIRVELGGYNE